MDYTQNAKIAQVTEQTLIIGVDVGSEIHYARAFNWRGQELSRKAFHFSNNLDGYLAFVNWLDGYRQSMNAEKVMVGCEPTGHYWFNFARYVKQNSMMLVLVNPYHVKQTKELDDNSPTKNDRKDPKIISKLVTEGRYTLPYMPDGVYADLRQAISSRNRIVKELNAATNRIQRWLQIYFPEFLKVYGKFSAESALLVLEETPYPADILAIGAEGVNQIWREHKLRAVGMKRAKTLVEAAKKSVGMNGGICARKDLQMLLEDFRRKQEQLKQITEVLEAETQKVPHIEKLLAIKGVGLITVAGFLAEVGDVGRFDSPKQIQKLAGLELKENSSGKHKGQSSISKRGRKNLRKLLFQAVLPLIRSNDEFREVYHYYTTRQKNPLKGKQAVVAVGCKLIRVFYAILTHGVDYDANRLRTDIIRPQEQQAA